MTWRGDSKHADRVERRRCLTLTAAAAGTVRRGAASQITEPFMTTSSESARSHRPRAVTVFGAALVAGAAAAFGVNRVLDTHLAQSRPQVEMEPILVALRSLPAGSPVTVWDVALKDWPKAMVPSSALRLSANLDNLVVRHPLREGQPILAVQLGKLEGGSEPASSGIATMTASPRTTAEGDLWEPTTVVSPAPTIAARIPATVATRPPATPLAPIVAAPSAPTVPAQAAEQATSIVTTQSPATPATSTAPSAEPSPAPTGSLAVEPVVVSSETVPAANPGTALQVAPETVASNSPSSAVDDAGAAAGGSTATSANRVDGTPSAQALADDTVAAAPVTVEKQNPRSGQMGRPSTIQFLTVPDREALQATATSETAAAPLPSPATDPARFLVTEPGRLPQATRQQSQATARQRTAAAPQSRNGQVRPAAPRVQRSATGSRTN